MVDQSKAVTISEAKREFEIRCCYWCHAELKDEINNSFPNLRLFRSGYGWKLHHFMQKLESRDQLTLANAMVKRNPTYLAASGETMTAEEKALWDSFERFVIEPSSLEVEIQSRKEAGEKIKLASKRKLRKAAVSKFVEAFGSQCFDMKLGEEWDPLFQMKCCGWIVSTQLTFGRRQPVLSYRHMIVSETRIAHPQNPQITGPATTLSPGVAWLANQWEDIAEDDVDSVCNALIKHAGFFFGVAPKLLAGLEFDKTVP
jgi:hypothetical protein